MHRIFLLPVYCPEHVYIHTYEIMYNMLMLVFAHCSCVYMLQRYRLLGSTHAIACYVSVYCMPS